MNTTDRLAGDCTTTTEETGARQAQDRAALPRAASEPASALPGSAAGKPSSARYPRSRAGEGTTSPDGSATVRAGTLPSGSTGLSGAEWRKAAARASRRRPAKAAPRAAAKVTIPPATTGAALTATAHCLRGCGVIAGPGDPAEVDKAARAHTEKAPKHPTNTVTEPAGAHDFQQGAGQ